MPNGGGGSIITKLLKKSDFFLFLLYFMYATQSVFCFWVMNKINDTQSFDSFLEGVDLAGYRKKYQPIKIVEMDLPRSIQTLDLMYEIYWDKREYVDFDVFYKRYAKKYERDIEEFRETTTMCPDCFYRGLPARIYRTWASIITQIHAGYVAEQVFGVDAVSMSTDLDRKNADIQVQYKGRTLNYQVKKHTQSREVRRPRTSKQQLRGEAIDIEYAVPSQEVFEKPKKLDGEYRKPYLDFMENKNLKRLSNGFVVFTPKVFRGKKEEIDNL